jgi:hypothetical protein
MLGDMKKTGWIHGSGSAVFVQWVQIAEVVVHSLELLKMKLIDACLTLLLHLVLGGNYVVCLEVGDRIETSSYNS